MYSSDSFPSKGKVPKELFNSPSITTSLYEDLLPQIVSQNTSKDVIKELVSAVMSLDS
jgi:hypothetical protein